jgi:hypothetical protein
MTRPKGLSSNYTYDNLSRLLSVLHQSGATIVDGANYTVDNAGNRTSKTDKLANVTSNYTYDPIYQLTQVTQSANTTESYNYDPGPDGNCYAPGDTTQSWFLDVSSATSSDPSSDK